MKKIAIYVTAALVLPFASCSDTENPYPDVSVHPVSGKVSYKGSPAAGAMVTLKRQGGDPSKEPEIIGIVQPDGTFELVSGPLGKGAPAGTYDVLVEWKRVAGQGQRRAQAGPDVLKGRYANAKSPLLHATIDEATTNLPPFQLN